MMYVPINPESLTPAQAIVTVVVIIITLLLMIFWPDPKEKDD